MIIFQTHAIRLSEPKPWISQNRYRAKANILNLLPGFSLSNQNNYCRMQKKLCKKPNETVRQSPSDEKHLRKAEKTSFDYILHEINYRC